jgi:hypothetical protein
MSGGDCRTSKLRGPTANHVVRRGTGPGFRVFSRAEDRYDGPAVVSQPYLARLEDEAEMMRSLGAAWQTLAAGLVLVLLCGCDPGRESLTVVRGKVSYKGVPLRTGTIVFTPDALRGTRGSMARSEIRSDGSYVLETHELRGAAAGWHRVTIMALDSGSAPGPNGDSTMPRSLLPEKYRDPELSGLSCQVRAGQDNRIDFHLN